MPLISSRNVDERLEALYNLYFTTDEGVYRLDSVSNTPARAGMPKGTNVTAFAQNVGTGFESIQDLVIHPHPRATLRILLIGDRERHRDAVFACEARVDA